MLLFFCLLSKVLPCVTSSNSGAAGGAARVLSDARGEIARAPLDTAVTNSVQWLHDFAAQLESRGGAFDGRGTGGDDGRGEGGGGAVAASSTSSSAPSSSAALADHPPLWHAVLRACPFDSELLRVALLGEGRSDLDAARLSLAIVQVDYEAVYALTCWDAACAAQWLPLSVSEHAVFVLLVPLADVVGAALRACDDVIFAARVLCSVAAAAGAQLGSPPDDAVRIGVGSFPRAVREQAQHLAAELRDSGTSNYFHHLQEPARAPASAQEGEVTTRSAGAPSAPACVGRDDDFLSHFGGVAEDSLAATLVQLCPWRDPGAASAEIIGPHCLVDIELRADRSLPGQTVVFDLDSLLRWALESPDVKLHLRGESVASAPTHPALLPWLAVVAQVEQLLHFVVHLAGFRAVIVQFDLHRAASAECPATMLMRETLFHHLKRCFAGASTAQSRGAAVSARFVRVVSFASPFDSRFVKWITISPPVAIVIDTSGPSALLAWSLPTARAPSQRASPRAVHVLDARTLRVGHDSIFAARVVPDARPQHTATCTRLRSSIEAKLAAIASPRALEPTTLLLTSSSADARNATVDAAAAIDELLDAEFSHCWSAGETLRARLARVKELPEGLPEKILRFTCLLGTASHLLCAGSPSQDRPFIVHSARIILITRCLQLIMPLRDRAIRREPSFPPVTSQATRRLLRTLSLVSLSQIKKLSPPKKSSTLLRAAAAAHDDAHEMHVDDFIDLVDGRLLSSILSFYSDSMGGSKHALPQYNQDPVLLCTASGSPVASVTTICVELLHQSCGSSVALRAASIAQFVGVVDGFECREAPWIVPPQSDKFNPRLRSSTSAKKSCSVLHAASRASGGRDGALAWPRAPGDLALHLPGAPHAAVAERSLHTAMQQFRSSCGWEEFNLASRHFLCTRSTAGLRGEYGGVAATVSEQAHAQFQTQSVKVATERLRKLAGLCWAERQALRRLAPGLCPSVDVRILSACVGEVMLWWPQIDGSYGTSATLSLDARALLDSTAQLLASFGCKAVAAYIGARVAQSHDPAIEESMARFLRANGTSLADLQLRSCEWAIAPNIPGDGMSAAEG